MRKYVIVALALIALTAGVVVSLKLRTPKSTVSPSYGLFQAGKPPAVDAEILAIESSPDLTKVALLLATKSSKKNQADLAYFVSIFDPQSRRIEAQSGLMEKCTPHQIAWSPDSSRIAIGTDTPSQALSVLSTGGEWRSFDTRGPVISLVWGEDSPDHIMYLTPDERSKIFDLDTTSGEEREISFDRYVIGLCTVKGKPCVSYLPEPPTDLGEETSAYVAEIDRKTPILRVPFKTSGIEPQCRLEMSPDGEYFFLAVKLDERTTNVIARTEAARRLLQNPHEAIMVQFSPQDTFQVVWPREQRDNEDDKSEELKALIRTGISGFTLWLYTGSRDEWKAEVPIRSVDWWQRETSARGKPCDRYLVVTDRGLEMCTYDNGFQNSVVLLTHNLLK